jgi:hypothetical protein
MPISGPGIEPPSPSRDDERAREDKKAEQRSAEKKAQFLGTLKRKEAEKAQEETQSATSKAKDKQAQPPKTTDQQKSKFQKTALGKTPKGPAKPGKGTGTRAPLTTGKQPALGGPLAADDGVQESVLPQAADMADTPNAGTQQTRQPPARPGMPHPPGTQVSGGEVARQKGLEDKRGPIQAAGGETGTWREAEGLQGAVSKLQERDSERDTGSDSSGGEGSGAEDVEGKPIYGLTGFTASAPRVAPTPQGRAGLLPSAILQQVIEFAGVHRNKQGEAEFHLGLVAGAMGGLRLKVTAFGNRRLGLKVSCKQKGAVKDLEGQVAALVDELRERDLEVVSVEIVDEA